MRSDRGAIRVDRLSSDHHRAVDTDARIMYTHRCFNIDGRKCELAVRNEILGGNSVVHARV